MKHALFHPEARAEFLHAASFYEDKSTGLGQRFVDEIERAVEQLEEAPDQSMVFAAPIRRKLLRVFPYGLLFVEGADEIVILAVMHLHRKPGYWKSRL